MTKKRDYFASFFATPSNDRTHPLQVIARVFVRSNLNQKQRDCFVPRNDKPMKNFNPADKIQDLQYFGEFGGVNPSISDSSTYTFLSAKTMFDTFEGKLKVVICILVILRR